MNLLVDIKKHDANSQLSDCKIIMHFCFVLIRVILAKLTPESYLFLLSTKISKDSVLL